MKNDIVKELNVYNSYLKYRDQVLDYTNQDMNLRLEDDKQVYIAVFDIPFESNIIGFQTQTLALVFGLNTHIYHGSGEVNVNLEENPNVKKAMQSLLISSNQVLSKMQLTANTKFYNSNYVRAYLKTDKGIYHMELKGKNREEKFLMMLLNNVLKEIKH